MKRTNEVEELVLPCPKENHVLEARGRHTPDHIVQYYKALCYAMLKI